MRIAELSRRSGVAVATIKYYLREGVLPPGERTSPNQASYDDTHVHRLRLVRALVDVGGLSIAAVREVLETVDAPDPAVGKTLGTVQLAVFRSPPPTDDPARAAAEEAVATLIDTLGWDCPPDHPAAQALVGVLVTAGSLGHERLVEVLPRYAAACAAVAESDLDYLDGADGLDDMLESVVVGIVLGDSALAALRRLAQVNEALKRYPHPEGASPSP